MTVVPKFLQQYSLRQHGKLPSTGRPSCSPMILKYAHQMCVGARQLSRCEHQVLRADAAGATPGVRAVATLPTCKLPGDVRMKHLEMEKGPGGRWGAWKTPPGQYHTRPSSSFEVTGR